jgi:hypothetical protein
MSLGSNRPGVGRTRIALAAFDAASPFGLALRSIEANGVRLGQLGFAAKAPTIRAFRAALSVSGLIGGVADGALDALLPLDVTIGGEQVLASTPFWRELACFGTGVDGPVIVAPWMAPQLRNELTAQLADGAALLGVRPVSAEQQRACTQALLSHASNRVYTHEFNLSK